MKRTSTRTSSEPWVITRPPSRTTSRVKAYKSRSKRPYLLGKKIKTKTRKRRRSRCPRTKRMKFRETWTLRELQTSRYTLPTKSLKVVLSPQWSLRFKSNLPQVREEHQLSWIDLTLTSSLAARDKSLMILRFSTTRCRPQDLKHWRMKRSGEQWETASTSSDLQDLRIKRKRTEKR